MSSAENGGNQLSKPEGTSFSHTNFSKTVNMNHFEVSTDLFMCFNPVLKPTIAFSNLVVC